MGIRSDYYIPQLILFPNVQFPSPWKNFYLPSPHRKKKIEKVSLCHKRLWWDTYHFLPHVLQPAWLHLPSKWGCSSLCHLLVAGGHTRDKHFCPAGLLQATQGWYSHTGVVSDDKGEQKRWWRGCHSPSFKTLFDVLEAGVDMLYLESQERWYGSNLNKACIYKIKPQVCCELGRG